MMEGQNLGAESQSFDRNQPICDVSKMVGGPVDVVADVADGGDKLELGSGGGGGKRKRGRPPKAQAKRLPAKKNKEEEEEEDVCFICFDGGSLVLCDRRGCPKAYHPACIKRDEAFFQSAAKWNCGWHICSICQKAAHHMCYTCTYSLCKGCIRQADYVCVRGDKGFCTICMKTIMLIENNGRGEDGKVQVDFDDKTSWEYLFKVYWVYLKGKLSLTLDELTQAKNPWKGASMISSVCSSTGEHSRASDPKSITSATAFGNLEENESKRRKIDEQINILHKETVNTEKLTNDGSPTTVGCKEWATKELLDFIAHMKNDDTSMLSQFDVQALMMEYIKRNNLRDPRKKGQIICDSRLKNLFGKSRVGHIEMLKRLELHFHVKDDSQKSMINSPAVHGGADWNSDNLLMVVKDKKPRKRGKGEERALQNKLDEYAAIDVHNMNLIYLRRNLMENLFVDGENFHGKVVGSIVRIRISGSDQKPDMYRLVQVVGTTKVDVPYKVGNKLADVMLEVLNLDKKETISIDTISDQEFSEEECRRLQQSIRCGLVRHFSVGEIQEKAVALQSLRLNDWMETEILRLSHLRDLASEKGHKKSYRECMEKLQLLSTPEERERRLLEIPEVHSDPKMNPEYESDDTEEYFNKEHGEHMESKYYGVSSKTSRAPKKRAESSNGEDGISWKNEQPRNPSITTCPYVEEGSTKATERVHTGKDMLGLNLGKSRYEIDCNGSTITNLNHETTLSSSLSNSAPDTTASSLSMRNTPSSSDGETDMVWHYHDPNGKVQGPFSLVQLQMWSTTGYFPADMRIWMSREDKSLLLSDVLKEHFHNKVGDRIGGPTVCSAVPSSTIAATPYAPNSVNYEKLPDSHGSSGNAFGQSWSANNNLTMSNESTLFNPSNVSSSTAQRNDVDIKHVSTASKDADVAIVDLPEKMSHEDDEKEEYAGDKMQSLPPSELLIQDSGNPPSWSSASSLVIGGAKLPGAADGWGGGSSTPVKREEWDSGLVSVSSLKPLEVVGDHVATPTSNIEQNIHSSSQPACNELPSWHGVGEMIEFSTLAEESVSDLLAEVDAMESQYGLPSPTSRRNSFVDDLFNGSFDEFSPTPDQGTRSDGFSSSGDIQLPCQSVTTTDEHLVGSSQSNNINAFDLIKTSNGLQQHSFISPEMDGETKSAYAIGIPQRNSENMAFRWPEVERAPQGMIDINRSAKAEVDEGEIETKTNDIQPVAPLDLWQNHGVSEMNHGTAGGGAVRQLESGGKMKSSAAFSGEHKEEGEYMHSMATAPKHSRPKLVDTRVAQNNHKGAGIKLAGSLLVEEEEDGEFIEPEAQPLQPPPPPPLPPPPPPPLTLGLDPFDPRGLGPETMQGKLDHAGRAQGANTSRNGSIGWDPNQRKYGGERFNSSSNNSSPRERSYQVEDSGHSRSGRTSWSKHSSFGSGSGSGGASYSRPPSKVQRVCKFYESGRCKKGASCKYLHP